MTFTKIEKLAAAIFNDVYSGLLGMVNNLSLNKKQLEEEVIETRQAILEEYKMKGLPLPLDLYLTLNCLPIDCKDIELCGCNTDNDHSANDDVNSIYDKELTITPHFEIPLIYEGLGAIKYIGTSDKTTPFSVYTSIPQLTSSKYRKRQNKKPYVYINLSPNSKGMMDCFIYNAPFLKDVSITAIFKDERLIRKLGCCETNTDHFTSIDIMVKDRLTRLKIQYYRSFAKHPKPNDLMYS